MDRGVLMKARTIAMRICRCICKEKNILFCSRSSNARVIVNSYESACKLIAYGQTIARLGDTLCRVAVEGMSVCDATIVRQKVAYVLTSHFRVLEEHIYGRFPSLLPNHLKDGNVDDFINHCREESTEVPLVAVETIITNAQELLLIVNGVYAKKSKDEDRCDD